jgi:hypothetical protein
VYIKTRIQKFASMRSLTAASQGKVPGPEGSIGKLFGGRVLTEMGDLAIDILGASAVARADDNYRWHQPLLGAPARNIAGGSDEVLKNIIGERVLGSRANPGRQGSPLARRAALTDGRDRTTDCRRRDRGQLGERRSRRARRLRRGGHAPRRSDIDLIAIGDRDDARCWSSGRLAGLALRGVPAGESAQRSPTRVPRLFAVPACAAR